MFRRKSTDLPQDPTYPADLKELGFKINEKGQFVRVDIESGKPAIFFNFFNTSSERANEVRKEAMHQAVRDEMLGKLGETGVKEVYVAEDGYAEQKPQGPHVTILTTDLSALKERKDVIVIVNEHNQNLGIWTHRQVMTESGLEGGSAVGLLRKLRAWGEEKALCSSTENLLFISEERKAELKMDGASEAAACRDATPGVIILNPGELIYSPQLNKSMSHAAWHARPKKNAIADNIKIDEQHNRVKGHATPEEHARSVFERVIPSITRFDARLFFVGLGDGCEHILNYFDAKFVSNVDDPVSNNLETIALMQPTHVPEQLKSESFNNFLATRFRAKSYITSERPKGEILVVPTRRRDSHKNANTASVVSLPPQINQHLADDSGSETSTSTPIAINRSRTRADSLTEDPLAYSTGSLRSLQSKISASNGSQGSYGMLKSVGALQRGVHSLPSSASSMGKSQYLEKSMAKLGDSASELAGPGSPLADSQNSLTQSLSHLGDSTSELAGSQATLVGSEDLNDSTYKEDEDDDLKPYDYLGDPVSCPTFSAGIQDVSELIWPNVMDDVLEWFKDMSEEAEKREEQMRVAEKEKKRGYGFAG